MRFDWLARERVEMGLKSLQDYAGKLLRIFLSIYLPRHETRSMFKRYRCG